MDTIIQSSHSHRWLLSVTFIILLHHCPDVSGSARACPQGQLIQWHMQKSRRIYLTCCYPTRCGVGEQVKPCAVNGTQDTCELCNPHYNQSLRTSSYTMDRCTYWPLNAQCRNTGYHGGHMNKVDWRTKRCLCNIELGFKYDPPESILQDAPADAYCQRTRRPCEPGFEPTVNGTCQPCAKNYFKPARGYRLCEPKTNCTMLGLEYILVSSSTADNNCSEPELITTLKPVVTEKPVIPVNPKPIPDSEDKTSTITPSTTFSGDVLKPGSSMGTKDEEEEDGGLLWPLVGAVLFVLVVVVAIALVLFYRWRKGMSYCGCDSNKTYTDPERYISNGSGNLPLESHKNTQMGNGGVVPHHLISGDKMINNNISNGGLQYTPGVHLTRGRQPTGGGGMSPTQFPGPDLGTSENVHFQLQNKSNLYPPSSNSVVSSTHPTGILRNGYPRLPEHMVYAQSCGGPGAEVSMDSIVREKLLINVDGMDANQELGENDPLLVMESHHADPVTHDVQFQNLAVSSSPSNSPPVVSGMGNTNNPMRFRPMGGAAAAPAANAAGGAVAFIPSSGMSPSHATQVTFTPSTQAVTFTRSTSVIASPEGEVEEEELEARVPRFSQLLPDGDESNSGVGEATNPILRMVQERDAARSESPMRETTQQLRAPTERLLLRNQYQPPAGPNYRTAAVPTAATNARTGRSPTLDNPLQQRRAHQGAQEHCIMDLKEQQLTKTSQSQSSPNARAGRSPALVDPLQQRRVQEGAQEHCIMDLKEQELDETSKLQSTPTSDVSSHVKLAADPNNDSTSEDEGTVVKMRSSVSETDQTELKTRLSIEDKDTETMLKGAKTDVENISSETKEPKQETVQNNSRVRSPSGGGEVEVGPNAPEHKFSPEGGDNNASSDRKRAPSGGSNSGSAQNTLERHRMASGDHQRPILKTGWSEEGAPPARRAAYGRTVSFEEEDDNLASGKTRTNASSVSGRDSTNSTDKSKFWDRAPLRTLSDSEQAKADHRAEGESHCESAGSNVSSKSSINSDISGSDSNHSNHGTPSRTAQYRRSQSENAPHSSSESPHKPPPRSMSEEKPQKLDRPIAKVKPMPASDSQLPVEACSSTEHLPVHHTGGNNNNNNLANTSNPHNILGYSSDDSEDGDSNDMARPAASAVRQEESQDEGHNSD